jgi:hypothetical protein
MREGCMRMQESPGATGIGGERNGNEEKGNISRSKYHVGQSE